MKKIFTLLLALLLGGIAAQAQLFRPLGLGEELYERKYSGCMPQLYVEDNTLYVCTNQGLYSKDLSHDGIGWQLAGFEGIPLLDYAHNGDVIIRGKLTIQCPTGLVLDRGTTITKGAQFEIKTNN